VTLPRSGGAPVSIIAHRGASGARPENTFEAFDEALRQGCDAIELDLQLTRDGVVVVHHDRTLARAGAGRRRVDRLDAAELAAAAPKIPALQPTLRRYGRRTHLLLEIKTREGPGGTERHLELARRTVELVRRAGLESRTAVLCFDEGVLDEAARHACRVPRVLNCKPGPRLGRRLTRRLVGMAALSVDVRTLTPGFGRAVRRAGCPLLVFTCNTARSAERAMRAGATGIMTNRPDWLRDWLSRRNHA
jgi:glycerophosphoryl diester phosphodiesterase